MSDVIEIEYIKVTITDLDEVLDLLAKEFYPRDNFSKGAGEDGEMSASATHSNMVLSWLTYGVSVGARDKATGSLIGVNISYVNTRGSEIKPEEEHQYSSEKLRNIQLVMKKTKELYDVFQDAEVDSVLECSRVCVHSDYCRRGIAKKMVEMSMELGAKRNCQLVRLLVTSPYTEKLCLRLGFHTKAELDLSKHEKHLFDMSLMDYTSVKVMTKRL